MSDSDDLFQQWAARHKGKTFVQDGIIDKKKWDAAKSKILFLLKEPYSDRQMSWDLRENIIGTVNEMGLVGSWRQASYWSYACHHRIVHGTLPSFPAKAEERELVDLFLSSAVLNVKKVDDGQSSSEPEVIKKYADMDGDLILQQVGFISPQVMICGYTWDCVKHLWPNAKPVYDPGVLRDGNLWIINFWHPANRYPHALTYYCLGALLEHAGVHKVKAAAA